MPITDLLTPGGEYSPQHLLASKNPERAGVVEENIRATTTLRAAAERRKTWQARFADVITRFSGDMRFLYLHAIWFAAWVLVNVGSRPLIGFDPYPFGLLTTLVSLEAIFLSSFVLISQNKLGEAADRRADLDLQINLLAEYEITRILVLVDRIAQKLEIAEGFDPSLAQLEHAITPGSVMEALDASTEDPRVK